MEKLKAQHKHIMRLIDRDADEAGWAKVSESLYPTLSKNMPPELIEFEKLNKGGRARLTEQGRDVLDAMQWL